MTLATLAAVKSATPPLIVAAVVGFVVALFQGVTQIQDQSLPLTLKILAVAAVFLIFGAALAKPVLVLADEAFRVFPTASR
ncbi:UNVERIFIED_CONTAM: hypothetical protein GTU68_036895 [Idotea baltica]|nr:hypothetical protein [Idotea baltica]